MSEIHRSAVISEDGRYRYLLERQWGPGPAATFVMLNPSTADAVTDDPTIRRCVGYARAWGCGALWVVNLYGLRTPDPADLARVADPVGPRNDLYLTSAARVAAARGSLIVAAWGTRAQPERVEQVLALPGMERLTMLGLTKDGHPRHPLYQRAGLEPQPFRR